MGCWRTLHNPVVAKQNRLHLRRGRHHAHVEFLPLCGLPQRRGWYAPRGLEALHGSGEDVKAVHGVSLLHEVGGHSEAHGSEADKANSGFGHGELSMSNEE